MAETLKDVNKFRLFVFVFSSLFSSLLFSLSDDFWTMKAIVSSILSAIISGLAYLQCPDRKI